MGRILLSRRFKMEKRDEWFGKRFTFWVCNVTSACMITYDVVWSMIIRNQAFHGKKIIFRHLQPIFVTRPCHRLAFRS